MAMPRVCLLITVAFTQSDVLSAHPAGLTLVKDHSKVEAQEVNERRKNSNHPAVSPLCKLCQIGTGPVSWAWSSTPGGALCLGLNALQHLLEILSNLTFGFSFYGKSTHQGLPVGQPPPLLPP